MRALPVRKHAAGPRTPAGRAAAAASGRRLAGLVLAGRDVLAGHGVEVANRPSSPDEAPRRPATGPHFDPPTPPAGHAIATTHAGPGPSPGGGANSDEGKQR